jgi:hypothetical protein
VAKVLRHCCSCLAFFQPAYLARSAARRIPRRLSCVRLRAVSGPLRRLFLRCWRASLAFWRASASDTLGKLPSPMPWALPSRLNRKTHDLLPVADTCR